MSTKASGRIIDGQGGTLENLRVIVRDVSGVFQSDLALADSAADGRFTLTYSADKISEVGTRKLLICVFTQSHRQLYSDSRDDVAADLLTLGDITIRQTDGAGWTVTLGGSAAALPVRDGNALRLLIDNEAAWAHIKESIASATTSIDVMQLEFDVVLPENPESLILLTSCCLEGKVGSSIVTIPE
jgi:hypothetical protein